jgi:hypothetical protein
LKLSNSSTFWARAYGFQSFKKAFFILFLCFDENLLLILKTLAETLLKISSSVIGRFSPVAIPHWMKIFVTGGSVQDFSGSQMARIFKHFRVSERICSVSNFIEGSKNLYFDLHPIMSSKIIKYHQILHGKYWYGIFGLQKNIHPVTQPF